MNDPVAFILLSNEIFLIHILNMLNKIQHDVMKIIYDLFMVIYIMGSYVVYRGFMILIFCLSLKEIKFRKKRFLKYIKYAQFSI